VARFPHRQGAGRELGHRLRVLRLDDPVVVAVSPGGVAVGAAAARVLSAPLDVANRPRVPLAGRPAVIVDEGLVTARMAGAAADQAAHRGASRLVLAVPVAAALELDDLYRCFDDLVCLEVGGVATDLADWYDELPAVTGDVVADALAEVGAARSHVVPHRVAAAPRHPSARRRLHRRFA
jgi:predicted phosphoribosyltransferase